MQLSRKRRKPRRSSERIDQPLPRPKPPPSVALPAPSAVQNVAPNQCVTFSCKPPENTSKSFFP
ncbi:hypothetical protein PCASD_07852 [Puccinia coronata f. sp. avenae]|uniref:Uncharacterized protein n=1 Tax=Puccinia coronata f. sp. avenae TaxID=200324 RepID=A0A2N5UQU6_9BASI|nr:hypothetical protein PCASD_07852 [Puccinia coronata f. sp. avenae]